MMGVPGISARIFGALARVGYRTLTTAMDGTRSARINTTLTNGKWKTISLAQGNLAFTANTNYTITFWAKASTAHKTHLLIQQAAAPQTKYLKKVIAVSTASSQYSFRFTSPVTAKLKMTIGAGEAESKDAKQSRYLV